MIDKRNETELKMHGLILMIIAYHEGGKIGRPDFQELMGKMRDVKTMLVNKQFGCWSGRHSSACACMADHPSSTIQELKKRA